ncbi:MAG: hypothetical protein ACT452_12650 [Microthrixaceae bacterium]
MTDDRLHLSHQAHGPDTDAAEMLWGDQDQWVVAMLDELDDEQMDALLEGSTAVQGLEPVAAVMRRLRASAAAEPVPPMSAALRALLDEPPARVRHLSAVARGSLARAAVAASVAAVALLGAGAAQNRLPTEFQDIVSSAAELVGIDVPRSQERDSADSGGNHRDADGPTVDPSGAAGHDGSGGGDGPGDDGSTPGAATGADPGSPGDQEPATPPDGSKGRGATGQPAPENGRATDPVRPIGPANGDGVAGSNGNGSTNSNPAGQANGTGNAK